MGAQGLFTSMTEMPGSVIDSAGREHEVGVAVAVGVHALDVDDAPARGPAVVQLGRAARRLERFGRAAARESARAAGRGSGSAGAVRRLGRRRIVIARQPLQSSASGHQGRGREPSSGAATTSVPASSGASSCPAGTNEIG